MSLRTTAGMSLATALAIGVAACGAGGASGANPTAAAATHASTTAAALSPTAPSSADAAPVVAAGGAPTPVTANQVHHQAPAALNNGATAAGGATTQAPLATTPAPGVTTPAPTTPAIPARRQPSAAEVNQVIARVHALIPLFTPTPAQIVKVGDQVCTAFDQGKTVAQIKATAMQMAGAYAALIPAGVADSAVRTIVTLFCPGYSSKLV